MVQIIILFSGMIQSQMNGEWALQNVKAESREMFLTLNSAHAPNICGTYMDNLMRTIYKTNFH